MYGIWKIFPCVPSAYGYINSQKILYKTCTGHILALTPCCQQTGKFDKIISLIKVLLDQKETYLVHVRTSPLMSNRYLSMLHGFQTAGCARQQLLAESRGPCREPCRERGMTRCSRWTGLWTRWWTGLRTWRLSESSRYLGYPDTSVGRMFTC